MAYAKIFKKVLFPCGAGVVLADGHTGSSNCCKKAIGKTRPSDLPLYSKDCIICGKPSNTAYCPSELEKTVGSIRKELWVWQDSIVGYRHKLYDSVNTGIKSTTFAVEFLREEANEPERYGAIALGGVAGLIFSLRGGFFKRVLYPVIGAGAMAAVCYPKEAAEYTDEAIQEGKKYFVVGYHFAFGEAPKTPEWLAKLGVKQFVHDENSSKEK